MAQIKVPYLIRRGQVFYWQPSNILRAAGFRPQRLPDDETGAIARARQLNLELEAWRGGKAIEGAPAPVPTVQPETLAAVIKSYKLSRFYLDLAASTRRVYDQNLKLLEAWAGDKSVFALKPSNVQTFYAQLRARTPTRARAIVVMLGIIYSYARRIDLLVPNIAARAGLKDSAPSGRVWPAASVAAFVAKAEAIGFAGIALAVALNEWFGQREGDILRLNRAMIRGERLVLAQSKTGAAVALPFGLVPAIAARIAAELARQDAMPVQPITIAARCLILDREGNLYGENLFRKDFAVVRAALAADTPTWDAEHVPAGSTAAEVATKDLQFMHLRHTAVVRMGAAGSEIAEIRDVTGHTLKSAHTILERYMVRTGAGAAAAFKKRLAREAE